MDRPCVRIEERLRASAAWLLAAANFRRSECATTNAPVKIRASVPPKLPCRDAVNTGADGRRCFMHGAIFVPSTPVGATVPQGDGLQ